MRRKEVKKILNELKMGFLLSRVYYAGNMFYISALRGDDRWFLIDDSLVLREGRWGTFFLSDLFFLGSKGWIEKMVCGSYKKFSVKHKTQDICLKGCPIPSPL